MKLLYYERIEHFNAMNDYLISGNPNIITRYSGTSTNVEIPLTRNGVPITEIGESCFANTSSVRMPNITIVTFELYNGKTNVTKINIKAFSNLTSLNTMIIADGVSMIASNAFEACHLLSLVELPNSLLTIESTAFSHCIN